MSDEPIKERVVLGDWGTSRLRLFLVEKDQVAARRDGPGIGDLSGVPIEERVRILSHLVAPWMDASRETRVILSGMAGSLNGLLEVPYVMLPTRRTTWAGATRTTRAPGMHITVAAGLRSSYAQGVDVMRGEETQVFGATSLDPSIGSETYLFVLPGTHSKWVEVVRGTVTRFRTALTGELYGLLRSHSTLLKATGKNENVESGPQTDHNSGILAGIERSSNLTGGLLAGLFEVRAAQLLNHRSHRWADGFLSGLLVGHEIASIKPTFPAGVRICIIGEPKLALLYQTVFEKAGIATRILDGADCAIAGLRTLRDMAVKD